MIPRSIPLMALGFWIAVTSTAAHPGIAEAASYQQVYAFKGGADGAQPVGQLTALDGVLYGVTQFGGGKCNCGTVYRVGKAGGQRVLHDFAGAPSDGAYPLGGLAALGSTLYGSTSDGGAVACNYATDNTCGVVFQITASGTEKVLHSLNNQGAFSPHSDLLARGGSVWGLSSYAGTVFRTFPNGKTDYFPVPSGIGIPQASLLEVGGTFYGTAGSSGTSACNDIHFCGGVFAMSPQGKGAKLYQFVGDSDGGNPASTLVALDGILYGTTQTTIFAMSLSGSEALLWTFVGGNYAAGGGPGLTVFKGVLYGVSPTGGGTGCGGGGCGTIYAYPPVPSGFANVIYRFQGGADGAMPNGRLLVFDGALYGVTMAGGSGTKCGVVGCGTVFRITIAP